MVEQHEYHDEAAHPVDRCDTFRFGHATSFVSSNCRKDGIIMLLADDELNTGISHTVFAALRLDALRLEQSRDDITIG